MTACAQVTTTRATESDPAGLASTLIGDPGSLEWLRSDTTPEPERS